MMAVTEFILLGFQVSQNIRILMFSLLIVIYWFTMFMNLLIITLVSTSKILHTPMYFISQLSISDILLTTDISQDLLCILRYYRGSITFIGCMTQFYLFGISEASECLLLTMMSYDRYVAICNPLRYSSIVTTLVKTSSLCSFFTSTTMRTRSAWTGTSTSGTPIAATWASSIVSTPLEKTNMTAVTEIILLGFQVSQNIRILMFSLLIVIYWFTMFMNLLIITLVSTSKILHTPMYFFISQLSITDLLLTSDIVPNMLYIILYYRGAITFIVCMTQFYFFGASGASEGFLLAVMSYDRYVAICNPLRYASIMTGGYCVILSIISWLAASSIMLGLLIPVLMLNFCGPNIIDHFFCDTLPLLELSCSDPYNVQVEVYFLGIPLTFIPIIIIIFSYTRIIVTILRIPSSTGRQKAFSTCSSHLIVVSIFFWTIFSVYVAPRGGQSSTISKILSLLYTVFIPLINPIIYSLKNNDIKKALHGQIYKRLRYMDDVLIIWDGKETEFHGLIDHLNTINTKNMLFTGVFGGSHLDFLDVSLDISNDTFVTKGFRKPTASNSLLHFSSSHPYKIKESIPFSQLLRLKRNNSDLTTYNLQADELLQRLRERG
ncbi:olfactory receptor 10A7-like [Dendropsophus ebraccatus]|uniref:olfactory receptor 10A7-like n=1 Tax=Dendropsophus ebraccatus TaxID=150705 RepID=UPI0038318342